MSDQNQHHRDVYKHTSTALGKAGLIFGLIEPNIILPFLLWIVALKMGIYVYALFQVLFIASWNSEYTLHGPGWRFWAIALAWGWGTWSFLSRGDNWRFLKKFYHHPRWTRSHRVYQPWLDAGEMQRAPQSKRGGSHA